MSEAFDAAKLAWVDSTARAGCETCGYPIPAGTDLAAGIQAARAALAPGLDAAAAALGDGLSAPQRLRLLWQVAAGELDGRLLEAERAGGPG